MANRMYSESEGRDWLEVVEPHGFKNSFVVDLRGVDLRKRLIRTDAMCGFSGNMADSCPPEGFVRQEEQEK